MFLAFHLLSFVFGYCLVGRIIRIVFSLIGSQLVVFDNPITIYYFILSMFCYNSVDHLSLVLLLEVSCNTLYYFFKVFELRFHICLVSISNYRANQFLLWRFH
jgi:hypothetical protein